MKMSQLVGRRIKETPKDASTVSHKFLIRGGYVRPVSAGIYSLLPVGKRIVDKIEAIIREEMNRIEGQEVLMPVVLPAELWEESGRYQAVGQELLRFKDRNDKPMILAMTHEEAVVHLVRSEVNSYKQLPVMLYQIQTKYRDEARPRAGMIRVREFTMKDAYSFHATQEDLEQYYVRAHEAYERIFKRVGMQNVLSILSNSGMMGGKISHEFMAICECGEDTIITNEDYSYKANREVATAAWKYEKPATLLAMQKVHTPDLKSIEDVSGFLGLKPENTGKAVFYQNVHTGELIFAMIRGDFEVNESKLANAAQASEMKFADDEAILAAGCVPGFASILNLQKAKVKIIIDPSVAGSGNLVVGANETDYHFINFNLERDAAGVKYEIIDIANVREGDPCPVTGKPLIFTRGIEVGNIFQLGTKYSAAMGCNYLDRNGKSQVMIMGCYGIGVGRTMASVLEQNYDEYGPIWPMSIAPYQVHLCAITPDKEGVGEICEKLYLDLQSQKIEVLYDDRGEKPGFMFNDADLLGIPLRVVVSPKTLAENAVEFKIRGTAETQKLPLDSIQTFLKAEVARQLARFEV